MHTEDAYDGTSPVLSTAQIDGSSAISSNYPVVCNHTITSLEESNTRVKKSLYTVIGLLIFMLVIVVVLLTYIYRLRQLYRSTAISLDNIELATKDESFITCT